MNLWIELTRHELASVHTGRVVINVNNIVAITDTADGGVIECVSGMAIVVKESYPYIKEKITDQMQEYIRCFGNQYVNIPPIKTTTNVWTIP